MTTKRDVEGVALIYVDSQGVKRDALGTRDWRGDREYGCINVAYINMDPDQTDTWGQKLARDSSVQHITGQTAEGRYWMFADEVGKHQLGEAFKA